MTRYKRQRRAIRQQAENGDFKRILVDMDDTLQVVMPLFVTWANKFHGCTFKVIQCESINALVASWREDQVKINSLFGLFFTEMKSTLPEVKGANEALRSLSCHYELFMGTARQPDWAHHTHTALDDIFPEIFPLDRRFFCNLHDVDLEKRIPKVTLVDTNDIDIIIEDSLGTALECAGIRNGKVKWVFLIDQPWNQKDDLPFHIVRIHGLWPEIWRLLKPK